MAADRTANRTANQISDSIFRELSSTRRTGAPAAILLYWSQRARERASFDTGGAGIGT